MDIRYTNDDFQFLYRTSAVIYNSDYSKVLLFRNKRRDFYYLPGGKIQQKENSKEAITREMKEELGFDNIDFSFLSVTEEFFEDKGFFNQQLTLTYKGIYNGTIDNNIINGLEGDWCYYEWVNVSNIEDYKIFPPVIKEAIKDPNKIHHLEIDKNNNLNTF